MSGLLKAFRLALLMAASGTFSYVMLASPSRLRPSDTREVSRVIPLCEFAWRADRIGLVEVGSIGTSERVKLLGPGVVDATPVSVTVHDTLDGAFLGSQTIWVGGPVNTSTGQFLDGYLVKGQRAYVALKSLNGRAYVFAGGYWPLALSMQGYSARVNGQTLSDASLRAMLAVKCPPPFSDLTAAQIAGASGSGSDGSVSLDGGI